MNTFEDVSTVYPLMQKLKSFIFNDNYLPPQLFFTFVLLQQIGLLEVPFSLQCFFYLGLVLLLFSFFNHFSFYSAALNNNLGTLIPMNIIVGLLGCNQKWKLYLFCFSLVFYLQTSFVQLKQLFIIFLSSIICISTYFTFIFPTPKQNLWFFCGFFTVCILHGSIYVLSYCFGLQFDILSKFFLIPVVILFAYGIIRIKFEYIFMNVIQNDYDPGQILHKIKMLKNQFKIGENRNKYIYIHRESCLNVECYCREYKREQILQEDFKDGKIEKQIINGIFVKSFQAKSWGVKDKLDHLHNYANFLLDQKQLTICMSILSSINQKQLQYFGRCDNFLIKSRLFGQIKNVKYFDNKQNKMLLLNDIDENINYLIRQIRQIIKDKVEIWVELCKENPYLYELERNGRKLVKRIEALHQYFMVKIRPCQQVLKVFRGTYVYATYLLLTTNNEQFANSLIKKTNKINEQKKSHVQLITQYGLFLEIKQNNNKSNDNSNNNNTNNGTNKSTNKSTNRQYELIIKNISSSLCYILNIKKNEILYKNINKLIPQQFKIIHDQCFNNFIKTNNFQESKSALIGNTVELPFKINNSQAVFLVVSSELRYDPISNKPLIQCMISKKTNNTINFIMNLDGKLLYRQSELFKDYANHQKIKSCIEKLKDQYVRDNFLQNLQQQFEESENMIKINCSPLFIHKFNQYNFKPLLRVMIQNDSIKNEKIMIGNFDTNKMKQEENVERIHNETDSQASTTSRKDTISNALTNLCESNSLKKQLFLTLTFVIFTVVSILCFNVLKDHFQIWDTSVKQVTPTYTIINMIKTKIVNNFAINEIYDGLKLANSTEAQARISLALYGNVSYEKYVFKRFSSLIDYQKNCFGIIMDADNDVTKKAKILMNKQIQIKNRNYPNLIPQNMTLQSIFINFISGMYYAQNKINTKRLLLLSVYLPLFYKEYTAIINTLMEDVLNVLSHAKRNNIILIVLINVLLLTFVVPIYRFHVGNKREFIKIYNLFVILDVKLIIKEIQKLERIQNEIFVNVNKNYLDDCSFRMESLVMTNNKICKGTKDDGNSIVNIDNMKDLRDLNKIRKRGGDLNIQGSDCDKKKVLIKDWISIIFIIIFLLIFNGLFYIKYNHIVRVEDQFKVSSNVVNFIENVTVALTATKMYMDDYSSLNRVKVFEEDLQEWLKNWIIEYENKAQFYLDIQNQIIKCSKKTTTCTYPFSLRLFEGLIKKYIGNGYENQKEYLKGYTFERYLNAIKVRMTLISGTYVLSQMNTNYLKWLQNDLQQLQQQQRIKNKNKQLINILFNIIIIIFIIFFIIYIVYIKSLYVGEVTLLCLLNKQMIFNNKNVESFVQKINRSLR